MYSRPFELNAARSRHSIHTTTFSFDPTSPELNISVPGVTAIEPPRTFWDKIVIVHGLRRWHEIRGELRQEGQRVSRHYYDIHCLFHSPAGPALGDRALGADCVRHARMFFDLP